MTSEEIERLLDTLVATAERVGGYEEAIAWHELSPSDHTMGMDYVDRCRKQIDLLGVEIVALKQRLLATLAERDKELDEWKTVARGF